MTQDAWEEASEVVASLGGGGGLFLRFEAGSSEVVVFCGVPSTRRVVWTGAKTEDYDEEAHKGLRPMARVSINCWLPGTDEVRIWEMSGGVFGDIVKLRGKYGLAKWSFEVARQGKGKETRWTILPEEQLTAEQRQKIDALTLHDLKALTGGNGGEAKAAEPAPAPREPAPDFVD